MAAALSTIFSKLTSRGYSTIRPDSSDSDFSSRLPAGTAFTRLSDLSNCDGTVGELAWISHQHFD